MLKHRRRRDDRLSRGFGGSRSRRFRPRRRPSGTTGLQIYIPRQTSVLMAKLPSSRPVATPQSRCPSDFYVAGRGANLRATLYQAPRFFTFPFWQPLRALHPCAQVRRRRSRRLRKRKAVKGRAVKYDVKCRKDGVLNRSPIQPRLSPCTRGRLCTKKQAEAFIAVLAHGCQIDILSACR